MISISRWRTLFDQYDPEGFGEIPWPDFMVLLARGDFREEVRVLVVSALNSNNHHHCHHYQVSSEKVDMLLELAYRHSSTTSAITFQQVPSSPSSSPSVSSSSTMSTMVIFELINHGCPQIICWVKYSSWFWSNLPDVLGFDR